MVTKGGYKLIDFGGVDISTSKTISGIYNKIANTDKRIVGCNIKLSTTIFKELTLDVKANGTSYELSNSILKITITNANAVVGEESVANLIDDIKDKDGNNRFIEGDVTLKNEITGVTLDYGKWSLSGTHLLVVASGTIANATALEWTGTFAICIGLPEWILDKIYTIGATSFVDSRTINVYNEDTTYQSMSSWLRKNGEDGLFIALDSFTATKDRTYRIAYDLLIDME